MPGNDLSTARPPTQPTTDPPNQGEGVACARPCCAEKVIPANVLQWLEGLAAAGRLRAPEPLIEPQTAPQPAPAKPGDKLKGAASIPKDFYGAVEPKK